MTKTEDWGRCASCGHTRRLQLGVVTAHNVFNQARMEVYGPAMAMTLCNGSLQPPSEIDPDDADSDVMA